MDSYRLTLGTMIFKAIYFKILYFYYGKVRLRNKYKLGNKSTCSFSSHLQNVTVSLLLTFSIPLRLVNLLKNN